MDLATGRRNPRVPIAQLIRRTLREIEPHARELGSDRELEGIREILARGNGADRQLRVFKANRDIVEVTREISDATEAAVRVAHDRGRRRLPGRARLVVDVGHGRPALDARRARSVPPPLLSLRLVEHLNGRVLAPA